MLTGEPSLSENQFSHEEMLSSRTVATAIGFLQDDGSRREAVSSVYNQRADLSGALLRREMGFTEVWCNSPLKTTHESWREGSVSSACFASMRI